MTYGKGIVDKEQIHREHLAATVAKQPLSPVVYPLPLPPHKAIYGLKAALAHNDGHISRLFVDCFSYI